MPRDESLDAFGMLKNSHRRLRERLDDLAHAVSGPLSADARADIEDVLHFFGRAVARHEADEEASLFPRIAGTPELAAISADLTREHTEQSHLATELGLALDANDLDALRRVSAALRASYERHIEREEGELFPAAERILDAAARAAMFEEMNRRRGR